MYHLPHFKAANQQEVLSFIHAHPFITLCGATAQGIPVATHVPVLIEERDDKLVLLAHIMRGQEHTKAFEVNPHVLAIFSGAHTYVSASWYKQQNIAGTWNYQAVHAQGILRFTDEAALYNLLVQLTARFEQADSPALVQYMKPGYVHSLMKYIIGFEIEITQIEHVFKLSQNRDATSYDNIIHQLQQQDEDGKIIADAMEQNKSTVFDKHTK